MEKGGLRTLDMFLNSPFVVCLFFTCLEKTDVENTRIALDYTFLNSQFSILNSRFARLG